MIGIDGTVKNGQVVLDERATLPEGTRVKVVPVGANVPAPGIEEGPMTPQEIEAALAAMDRIEPPLMTPEEEARWKADLKAQRDHDAATFPERAEKLRRMWE